MTTHISTPIHIATVNGKPLRFFRSPMEGPDFPWFAFNNLMLCFAVTAEVKNVVMSKFVASEWRGHSRLVVDDAGEEIIICPHFMARGLLGAMEQNDFVRKGALETYLQAWTDALKQLTADLPIGSPEWLAWMKQAVSRGGDDNTNPVLNPTLAFLEAAEKYGKVVHKDGERFLQIAMPDDGADAAPPTPRPVSTMLIPVEQYAETFPWIACKVYIQNRNRIDQIAKTMKTCLRVDEAAGGCFVVKFFIQIDECIARQCNHHQRYLGANNAGQTIEKRCELTQDRGVWHHIAPPQASDEITTRMLTLYINRYIVKSSGRSCLSLIVRLHFRDFDQGCCLFDESHAFKVRRRELGGS
jgi:hypothetical protein